MVKAEKWTLENFSSAMEQSILAKANPRYTKLSNDKLLFNGFWRDGDRPNVCLWLKKATWADAKTGQGGGCKEFANIAFGMNLPEFMDAFGTPPPTKKFKRTHNSEVINSKSVHEVWSALIKSKTNNQIAENWLTARGLSSPQQNIGSGFLCLEKNDAVFFDKAHQAFIEQRLTLDIQLVAPIRNVFSNDVQNLFFRSLTAFSKENKSRLLPDAGGWSDSEGSPRAFGFPSLVHEFPKIILCEGMADYFAAECLLAENEHHLAIGAAHASALVNWAQWLGATRYKGTTILLYQLDKDEFGKISPDAIGQAKAIEALKILRNYGLKAELFDWNEFLKSFKNFFDLARVSDLADVCQLSKESAVPLVALTQSFYDTLNHRDKKFHE